MPTTTARKTYPFTGKFKEWLAIRNQATLLGGRQTELRDGMKGALAELGEEDDKGHFWIDLRTPVEFTEYDAKGKVKKVFRYTALKLQKALKPKDPVPDADKSEALLREKGLWLTEVQEEQIRQLQMLCPNVTITVDPDVDAVSALYIKGVISEDEYNELLPEQQVEWSFIACEEK